MRGAGRRRAPESLASDRRPPPPTPTNTVDPWQHLSTPVPGRDSDASFCSSRPSIASGSRPSTAFPNTSDKSQQLATVNAFLASNSREYLKPPFPSAKDVTETIKFLFQLLGFSMEKKLDEDLVMKVLKQLKCPCKLNKSILKSPNTPHAWPNVLAVIHWLVQIVKYHDHLLNSPSSFGDNVLFKYEIDSYLSYIRGDDLAVDALDEEFMKELKDERDKIEENVKAVEETANELEAKLESLKKAPSQMEALEQEKALLEKDVTKFYMIIEQLDGRLLEVQKMHEEKEKELEVKVAERKRICEENEELKRTIEEQRINARDAERMKRELQAVEREIEDADASRNGWEEKTWELDSEIGHKFKELEWLTIECNQAIRRLKLGIGFQYQLNAKGSTPVDILGSDYKSILKPALTSFAEETKRSSVEKWEELISLQQQSGENAAKIEEKRNRISSLQSYIDDVGTQVNLIRKEMQEYSSRCAAEARKMVEEIEAEALNMDVVEKEASEYLKTSKAKYQETVMQCEREFQLCVQELFSLVDSVSQYKEYMGSKIADMKNNLLQTAAFVADIHKGSRPLAMVNVPDSSN